MSPSLFEVMETGKFVTGDAQIHICLCISAGATRAQVDELSETPGETFHHNGSLTPKLFENGTGNRILDCRESNGHESIDVECAGTRFLEYQTLFEEGPGTRILDCQERVGDIPTRKGDRKRGIESLDRSDNEQVGEANLESNDINVYLTSNEKNAIWGDYFTMFNFEGTKEGDRNNKVEKVYEMPISANEQKSRRSLLDPLFKVCKDKLWMREDHLVNFTSCDHILTTPVGRELMDRQILKLSDLKQDKVKIGHLVSLRNKKRLLLISRRS